MVASMIALAPLGCAPAENAVRVPERPGLPARFVQHAGEQSSAALNWREYFGEPRLAELIAEALRGSFDLAMALQRIEIVRAGARASANAAFPRVALQAGAGVQKFGLYTAEGSGAATTEIEPGRRTPEHLTDFSIGLVSSWELDLWGKLKAQRRAAFAQYLASIEGANLVLTSLVADVAVAYFELLAADNVLATLEQAVKRNERALEVVKLQKEAARANLLAVQQFEAQLLSSRAQVNEAERHRAELENRINFLLGRYPRPIPRQRDSLFKEPAQRAAAGVPSELLRNRPDIREAELELRASELDVEAARAAFFPSVQISAGVGLQAFNPAYLVRVPESLTDSLFGNLIAPLVNRSALEASFATAKATQIQAMYRYQKAILNGYVEVANALTGIEAIGRLIALKQVQRDALAQSVMAADELYRAGRAGYLEVLVAQQSSLAVELELIEALERRRILTVAVYKALGGGWR